jgi:post-segregation antitoxin (ccd killing protein)
MNKIRRTKATRFQPEEASAEAAPATGTSLAPEVETGGDVTALTEAGRRWQRENRAAIDCYNRWIAEHGLPLEEFRGF